MTHLYIQQGSNVEIVSALIIKKLYDTALTVSEPEQGETDAAYMSGHISVSHTYAEYVEYLAGKIGRGTGGVVTSIVNNPSGRFQDLTIDVVNDFYIKFEDPEVERVLLAAGIGDGVGISISDAANATVGTALRANTTITSFDEFGYFTKENNSPTNEMFKGCTNLESIDLSNITIIPNSFFYDCSNLVSVTLPSQVTTIGNSAFRNATNLSTINLNNITFLGSLSFDSCTLLNTIILPNIQTVWQLAFRRTDNQQNRVIDCGPNLTSWVCDQFGNDAKVTIILRGSSVPSMSDAFYNRGYWDTTIYVPRDMIAVYKADTDGWGRISGRNGREVFYALEDSIYANTNWYQQQ